MLDIAAEVELIIKALGLAAPCIVDARLKFDRDRSGTRTFELLSVSPASAAGSDVTHLITGRLSARGTTPDQHQDHRQRAAQLRCRVGQGVHQSR
jgi:hypothetical protein